MDTFKVFKKDRKGGRKMNEKFIAIEIELFDYLDKHFPKGKSKLRGQAIVLIALAKEYSIQERALQEEKK